MIKYEYTDKKMEAIMKNKIKLGIITIMCALALACGEAKPSGKVLFESPDKKVKVYESEVNNEIQKNLFAQGLKESDIPKDQLEATKKSIVQSIALTKAMALEAKAKKLDSDKKYTESIEMAKDNILATLNVADQVNKVNVTDDEAKKYYDANPSAFTRPDDVVKLQLIVITSGNQAKADTALKEATANPNNFTEFVKKYSEIPNAGTGETNDLPLAELAKTHAAISEAVKGAQKGQVINSIIKIGNEWYIVKLLDKEPKGLVAYDKVKDMIKNQMKVQKRQEANQKYVQEIADKYNIK
jgi:putative liporotein